MKYPVPRIATKPKLIPEKERPMQKIITFTIAILTVLVLSISACAKSLTREKAAELISKRYPRPVIVETSIGTPTVYSVFERHKLVEGGRHREGDLYVADFIVTEEGKKYILPKVGSGGVVKVRVADEIFNEVTGIRIIENGTSAEVEYTWKYKTNQIYDLVRNTEFFRRHHGWLQGEVLHKNTLRFSLFDDGWRIDDKSKR
jgi:hypothetical protein